MKKILLIAAYTLFCSTINANETIGAQIASALENDIKNKNAETLKSLYKSNNNKPLWITENNPTVPRSFIKTAHNPFFNYKNKMFGTETIERLSKFLQNKQLPEESRHKITAILDITMTNSYLNLIRFVVKGDIDWELVQQKLKALKRNTNINAVWEMKIKPLPPEKEILLSIRNRNTDNFLYSLIPMEERYEKLIKMLTDYRNMEKFPKIEYSKELLKKGDKSSKIINIKKRLQITGDYPSHITPDDFFGTELEQAVIRFQKRHLVKPTGLIGKTSTYYLNRPIDDKINSIITNLDKTKLYPKEFEKEHLEVNIPEFKLKYYKNRRKVLNKNIIVGRTDRPTPIFSDRLEYMVLNPTWTIPPNLVKKDIIPAIKKDPSYLERKHIRTFIGQTETKVDMGKLLDFEKGLGKLEYKFVQSSGEDNALGKVKFMFPNKHAVYLHDTNNKSLFSHRYKIFSSGCMRVEKPFELVDVLIGNTWKEYPKSKIENIVKSNSPTNIGFKKKIPVHILYFTIYEKEGRPHFINDIYLYDRIIEESAEGRKLATFKAPKSRMVSVKTAH